MATLEDKVLQAYLKAQKKTDSVWVSATVIRKTKSGYDPRDPNADQPEVSDTARMLKTGYNERQIDGDRVRAGDASLLVHGSLIAKPDANALVVLNNVYYSIVNVTSVLNDMLYKIQIRKGGDAVG